jgi:hypothetical protein
MGKINMEVWRIILNLCNETNQMHYVSLIYFINQPLHVSGIFIAHHQEVKKGKTIQLQAKGAQRVL